MRDTHGDAGMTPHNEVGEPPSDLLQSTFSTKEFRG